MKQSVIIVACVWLMLASGCAPVQKIPVVIDGSKADGTVTLAYSTYGRRSVEVDWTAGHADAISRCRAWGYSRADFFPGVTRTCNSTYGGACNGWQYTNTAQCTGSDD